MAVGYIKLRDFKGVDLTNPPTEIADDKFAWARNCFGGKRGYVGPRTVQTAISAGLLWAGTTILGDYLAGLSLYGFVDKDLKQRMVFWVPGNVSSAFFLGNASGFDFSAGPFITVPGQPLSTLSPALGFQRPGSLVYNNELYLFPGHTVPGLIFGSDDATKGGGSTPLFRELGAQGTGWTAGAGLSGERYKFTFGEVYRGVFALGGLPPPYESLLFFTNAGATPDQLLSLAKTVGVGYGDGDRLIATVSTPIVGGNAAVEPYLMAFKQRSVWLVQGVPPSATDNGTLVVSPVMRREGLVSPSAVCVTPYGIVFCSGRNVWLMPPGTQPKPIGDDIKGFLEKLPQQPVDSWSLEFHEDTLYLNFPSPAGVVTGKGFGATGATRTYLPTQQMWCDLRKPDEPRWWGPQDVRATHMKSLYLPDGSRQMSGLTVWDEGAGNVRVQPFTMNGGLNYDHATTTGQTVQGEIDLGDPGTLAGLVLGESIPCSNIQVLRTREMDFGDDSLEKIIEALEVNATWDIALGAQVQPAAGSDSPFLAVMIKNGGADIRAGVPPVDVVTFSQAAPQTTGFVLDQNVLDGVSGSRLFEQFVALPFFPAGSSRLLARTLQLLLLPLQTASANPATTADQYRTRKFTIKSMTVRLRPIGRRPGGSYGG